eukprot:SAG25_NODE_170_length_13039_cov_23.733153_7_plen_374_part_00
MGEADAATPAPVPGPRTSRLRRASIYAMLSSYILALKVPRLAIPSLVPFMVQELGLPQTTVPTLLAAFHPGYVAANLPGGPLVQAIGAKRVGLAGLAGTALAFALFPAAGRLRSPRAVTALVWLMVVMGAFQGPLSPVLMQTNTNWIPTQTAADKMERTWSIRFQSLMHSFSPALAVAITPRLAQRFGWARVCSVFAGGVVGYGLLWQACFADTPPTPTPEATPAAGPSSSSGDAGPSIDGNSAVVRSESDQQPEQGRQKKAEKKVEYGILTLPNSLTLIAYHVAFDMCCMTMIQLAPTMFMSQFQLSAVQMSKYVGVAQMCHVPAGFAVSALDSWLIQRGVPPLAVRRWMTCSASILEALWAVAYGAQCQLC